VHARQPVLAALLGRLNGDLLPFRLLLNGAFGINLNDSPVGNDRRYVGRTDLDRLVHDQLHVFSLRNCLSQNDPASKRWRFGFVQFSQADFATARIDNFGSDFAAASVEKNKLLAALHPQNVARMVGFRVRQHERIGFQFSGEM
jgi:hypothetical protein